MAIDKLIVFRELTKLHESVYRGAPKDVLNALSVVAGEFTVVVPRRIGSDSGGSRATDAEVVAMFGQMIDVGGRAAARAVGARTGRSANDVYDLLRRHKPDAVSDPVRDLD